MHGAAGLHGGALIEGIQTMRLAFAAGIAAGGLAFSALAHEMPRIDANQDGWVTRAEAAALAERVFAELDSNDDNKLDAADRSRHQMFELHLDGGDGAGQRIERRIERHIESSQGEHVEMHIEDGEEAHVERRVIIRRGDGGEEELDLPAPPHAPHPPHPPHAAMAPHPPGPPMFMMLIANSEEADLNGDDALSLEEFRAQHLRFFDASDANGDGRVHFEPPEAPEPPAPPR